MKGTGRWARSRQSALHSSICRTTQALIVETKSKYAAAASPNAGSSSFRGMGTTSSALNRVRYRLLTPAIPPNLCARERRQRPATYGVYWAIS